MKPSSAKTRITAKAAKNCFLLNQFATPGLGSLMAKRWLAGTGQLVLAVAGCGLVVAWFIQTMKQSYASFTSGTELNPNYALMKAGAIIFIAAWIWSLITSLSIVREAEKNEDIELGKPPVLK
jgi:hypothetical protein